MWREIRHRRFYKIRIGFEIVSVSCVVSDLEENKVIADSIYVLSLN